MNSPLEWEGSGGEPIEYDVYGEPQADNPAAEEPPSVSLDEQIKAFEALRLAQEKYLKEQARAKRVSFANEALLYGSDRTEEEVEGMWYSRDELNEFKNERKEIVKVLKQTNFDLIKVEQSGRYCLRGYEPYFSLEVNKAMKYARSLVSSLVLAEQERQRRCGMYDEEALRESSCCASQWARDNALQLGRNDEIEVFGEFEEAPIVEVTGGYYSDEEIQIDDSPRKRKEAVEQPEFESRPRNPDDDDVAERLDSALRLIEALKYGKN